MKPEPVNVAKFSGGPAFQLTLELGFGRDHRRMERALSSFWECRRVTGPWLDSSSFGDIEHTSFPMRSELLDKTQFGILTINSDSAPLPFALFPITEEGALTVEKGALVPYIQDRVPENSAWLTLNLTSAQLAKQFHVDDSWTMRSQPWLALLCDVFAEIVDAVHARAPLKSAAIGEEISGCFRRPTQNRLVHDCQGYPPLAVVSTNIIENRGGLFVDRVLWDQLNPKMDAVILPSGLYYVKPQLDAALLGA